MRLFQLIYFVRNIKREALRLFTEWQFQKKFANAQILLDEALEGNVNNDPIILFLPGLSWKRQLFQRPQQLARSLARQGALVFYVEPEINTSEFPILKLEENLYLCNCPVKLFQQIESPWIYVLTWSLNYFRGLDHPKMIYDIVDDLSAFIGDPNELRSNHEQRLKHARIILVSSERLVSLTEEYRIKTCYCPNAADFVFFQNPSDVLIPAKLREIRQKNKSVVGYIGAIAPWIDFDLLEQVTHLRPAYEFVLIGPTHDQSLLKRKVFSYPNFSWIGRQDYASVPSLMQQIDVGMIPFLLNNITHATSPIKLFEFYAASKPVVITPMEESLRYPGVLVGSTPHEFATQIDSGIENSTDPDFLSVIIEFASQNTWEERAQQILALMHKSNSDF